MFWIGLTESWTWGVKKKIVDSTWFSYSQHVVVTQVCSGVISLEGESPDYCKVPCKRPSPLKHKFLRKVGGGRLLGILPFVQSIIQPLKVTPKDLNSNKNPIYSNFKTKGKRKLVIFKHTHPVYLSQSQTGHIATENHSQNFRFPLALLLRFIVSFSSSLK